MDCDLAEVADTRNQTDDWRLFAWYFAKFKYLFIIVKRIFNSYQTVGASIKKQVLKEQVFIGLILDAN